MPPSLPSATSVSRVAASTLPSLARNVTTSAGTAVTPNKPPPSKDHHIHSYSADAFPLGFSVSSTHAGIKKKAGVLDLGILISTAKTSCSAAACMTRNVFQAAPVTVTSELLLNSNGKARGFIINSGCANAVTGKKGLEDAWSMSNKTTSLLSPSSNSSNSSNENQGTLVMSTGVIGQNLPISKILENIPKLVKNLDNSPKSWLELSKAFMTTDTFPKLRCKSFRLGDREIKFVGIDKGAGMIAPSMGPPQPPHATLLGVIATDAAVNPKDLQNALNYAVDRSFNNITVDGDMSTNDTILCLANGAATSISSENPMEELSEKTNPKEFGIFKEQLREFAEELAQLVVRDGEGATKFVTIRVKGAPTYEIANAVAKSVANSSLFKTAMYGEDANWGRILCAVGYTPLSPNPISPTSVSVSFLPPSSSSNTTPLRLLTNGEPESDIDEERASEILKEEDLEIEIDLGDGKEESKVWTCDFSHEYVTINGSVSAAFFSIFIKT
ncbi:glutamate N-acetyltransferase/amino-acid acetyltransferase [Kwoniella pini CBS 10737]|uniref:Arginine biosynthesis bifunctional protein ArgJ, mitochondrial n=1 Tax=Kwoniella pini CBS 10737 TaxID=1296096 RepID=A0A1B9I7Q2_9TREE|nr:arginine biosynthesis ArgJ, mitochondrial [Kwoniella pini CBS 10737]OCF51496.1 arginine biosynthesis ArgJ, mitochondrial [Kwoniella pini CBS 10737]